MEERRHGGHPGMERRITNHGDRDEGIARGPQARSSHGGADGLGGGRELARAALELASGAVITHTQRWER